MEKINLNEKSDNNNNKLNNNTKKELEALSQQLEQKDNQVLSKDEEIKRLKASLSEAKTLNKVKKGDVRAEVNRQGDIKLKCIGTDESGKRIWKKANELTDADIIRMADYRTKIKQNNAKKYNN